MAGPSCSPWLWDSLVFFVDPLLLFLFFFWHKKEHSFHRQTWGALFQLLPGLPVRWVQLYSEERAGPGQIEKFGFWLIHWNYILAHTTLIAAISWVWGNFDWQWGRHEQQNQDESQPLKRGRPSHPQPRWCICWNNIRILKTSLDFTNILVQTLFWGNIQGEGHAQGLFLEVCMAYVEPRGKPGWVLFFLKSLIGGSS